MRQFWSWRVWVALASTLVLLLALDTCRGDDVVEEIEARESRRIDLIALTTTVRSDSPWSVSGGRVNGNATAVLADGRVLQLLEGTLGQSTCLFPEVPNACVLLADTLGQGIVWFTLVPSPPSGATELELPSIDELLEGVTYARLNNGLEVPLLDVVERRCEEETPNLSSFVQRFDGRHVTIVDLASAQVSAVECVAS